MDAIPLTTSTPWPPPLHWLRPGHSRRPAAWRWQLAEHLAAQRECADHPLDRYARAAVRLCRHLAQDESARQRVSPTLLHAHAIWQQNDRVRWELEARLLADEPVAVIAMKVGVPQGVVAAYGKVFFDVADRLRSPSFITHLVIGPRIQYGLTAADVDTLWLHFGFWAGSHVIDAIIEEFDRSGQPDYGYLLDPAYSDADRSPLDRAIHRAVRIRLMSLTEVAAAVQVCHMYWDMLEQEQSAQTQATAAEVLCQNAQGRVDEILPEAMSEGEIQQEPVENAA
jgi:hypothetical protein